MKRTFGDHHSVPNDENRGRQKGPSSNRRTRRSPYYLFSILDSIPSESFKVAGIIFRVKWLQPFLPQFSGISNARMTDFLKVCLTKLSNCRSFVSFIKTIFPFLI